MRRKLTVCEILQTTLIFTFEEKARRAIADGADVEEISNLPVRERIGRFKAVPYADYKAEADSINAEMTAQLNKLAALALQK